MIRSYGVTDVGSVRKSNEDRVLIDPSLGLYIVADGMGGHSHGAMAADLTIATMQHYVASSRDHLDVTWPFGYNFDISVDANRMTTAIQLANRQVWRQSEQAPEYGGMGSTITAVLTSENHLTAGNLGDSRVYLWREGALRQLTVDDTWLQAMSGHGSGEIDLFSHPLRNFLTQAAGSKDLVNVHINEVDLDEGDIILMSSDGLHSYVAENDIAAAIGSGATLPETGTRLVQLATAAGGSDNISVVLLAYTRPDLPEGMR